MDDGGWDRDYRQRGRLYGGGVRLPPLPDGARVLEIGCGDGRTLTALDGRPCTVVGLDRSSAALALCRPAGELPAPARPWRRPSPAVPGRSVQRGPLPPRPGPRARGRAAVDGGRGRARDRARGRLHLRVFSHEDLRAGAGREVERGRACAPRASSRTTHRGRGRLPLPFVPGSPARDDPVAPPRPGRGPSSCRDRGGSSLPTRERRTEPPSIAMRIIIHKSTSEQF